MSTGQSQQPANTGIPGGIFDKTEKRKPAEPSSEKKEFKDPFAKQQEEISQRAQGQKPKLEDLTGDSTLERTAGAVNNAAPGKNIQADLDEMDKVDPKDIELAEQMIFRGWAETDVEITNLKGHKFTICSTSAEELSIIDEIIFNILKKAESKDGSVNLPQAKVQGIRNGLFIAISYRGMDQQEVMTEASCQLNNIKKAIIRVSELEGVGEFDEAEKLKESLKKKLLKRGVAINRLATPVIDFLSNEKFEFDAKMTRIFNTKELLPKS